MHVNYSQESIDERNENLSGTLNGTLDISLDELALLNNIRTQPRATQETLASQMSKSVRTVKRLTASLTQKGYIKRENGKRDGHWVILKSGYSI